MIRTGADFVDEHKADHDVRHGNATDGSEIRPASKVRINTWSVGVVQSILVAVSDPESPLLSCTDSVCEQSTTVGFLRERL